MLTRILLLFTSLLILGSYKVKAQDFPFYDFLNRDTFQFRDPNKLKTNALPIDERIALREITKYFDSFENTLHSTKNCFHYKLQLNAVALWTLIYYNYYNCTHIQIEIGQIPENLTTPFQYYNNNPKKMHLIYYLYDSIQHRQTAGPFDLNPYISTTPDPYPIEQSFADQFTNYYRGNLLNTYSNIRPDFYNTIITGLQKVNIRKEELYDVLYNDAAFTEFDIFLGLTDINDIDVQSNSYYQRLHGLNKTVNLLFRKVYPTAPPPPNNDLYFYDLNDACPPGSCY
jgi:hypothetical protein